LLPPLKQGKNKIKSKKARKALEEETIKKRTQQRRSTSDLVNNGTVGRDMRAQALAKQSATLKSISERGHETPLPTPRRPSAEYNGRPSMMLGADVSRAMKWAEGRLDQGLPEMPKTARKSSQLEVPRKEVLTKPREEITKAPSVEPTLAPKPQSPAPRTPEPKTTEPRTPVKRPILLEPEAALHKNEKLGSPPNKFKKFFGGKSKEEKAAKRASRVMSPIPPSPQQPVVQPATRPPAQERKPSPSPVRAPPTPSPVGEIAQWDEDFDGTHRPESPKSGRRSLESPVDAPTFPDPQERERTSQDSELDRWAQIRNQASQRALNRAVAPPKAGDDDDILEVNVPRVRQQTPASPKRKTVKGEDEDEETVDARVARIRKRVQELTAGMGD
jgi:hypothetical protein